MRPYIDVHCHIGMTVSRAPVVGQSVGRYMGRMAAAGVVAAILCPTSGGPQARGVLDTQDQDEVISQACRRYPDRFPVGLGVVEVRHEGAGVAELARAMDAGGLMGFGSPSRFWPFAAWRVTSLPGSGGHAQGIVSLASGRLDSQHCRLCPALPRCHLSHGSCLHEQAGPL
ncbi:MAG: hypothetical protein R3E79_53930 [Caldilineaceae bacterium]